MLSIQQKAVKYPAKLQGILRADACMKLVLNSYHCFGAIFIVGVSS